MSEDGVGRAVDPEIISVGVSSTSRVAGNRYKKRASGRREGAETRTVDVPPNPAALIESMRAFGYRLPAAIADLIDNSITADAANIWIDFHWAGRDSWIAIRDDGHGMDATTLTNAMRLGSRSPVEERDAKDLGRFGLGLKTAGLSQSRALTVASREQGGEIQVRRWDLDFVTRTGEWSLLQDAAEGASTALAPLGETVSGTVVLLDRLDRIDADAEDEPVRNRFFEEVGAVEEHLGMVFHRFLGRGGITLHVNGNRVEAWDPFLTNHAATQELATEDLHLEWASTSRYASSGTASMRAYWMPFSTAFRSIARD